MVGPSERTIAARFGRAWRPDPGAARWYARAGDTAAEIADDAGVPFDTAAGVLAALSPRVQWRVNVRYADTLCRTGDCPGLSRSRAAARRILDGQCPGEVLKGPKTHAFYRAISGDLTAAVVDVWMLRAAGWPTDAVGRRDYRIVARALTTAARRADRPTAVFQAEVWTAVRGRAG